MKRDLVTLGTRRKCVSCARKISDAWTTTLGPASRSPPPCKPNFHHPHHQGEKTEGRQEDAELGLRPRGPTSDQITANGYEGPRYIFQVPRNPESTELWQHTRPIMGATHPHKNTHKPHICQQFAPSCPQPPITEQDKRGQAKPFDENKVYGLGLPSKRKKKE